MPLPRQLLYPALIILLSSCKNENTYTYAIKDFRKPLQPYLTQIVSKGIVGYYNGLLSDMATDKDLMQLGQSEHPVLRASAFREMLNRKSFNHFDILMNHLDDTAIVATDAGEFGIWYRAVSDDILDHARWKTQEAKNRTIEQVLTKHNYLRSAYLILLQIEPQKKYYSFIKDMATRPRRISEDGYELDFNDIEYALYGLAKFRRVDDIKIIEKQLMGKVWQLSDLSFRLMKEFPDTAYLDIFQTYHRRQFYRFSGQGRGGFTGTDYYGAEPQDFIRALAVQQNDRSAKLFDTILQYLPSLKCRPDKGSIEDEVVMQIWEHPNPAYARLRERVKTKAEKILKERITIDVDRHDEQIDSTIESIRW